MRAWHLLLIPLAVGCGSNEDDQLQPYIKCEANGACPSGHTCLVDRCIKDGSLPIGETCMDELQCGPNLVCHNFICKPGCSRVYHLDDCPEGNWCKPIPDPGVDVGDCAPSECDPATTEFCEDGSVCVAFAPHVGGCLTYCEYGFSSGAYGDSCTDTFEANNACQSLGVNFAPVCLPAGTDDNAPTAGDPGCHPVYNPCLPGTACVNVVCRELCFPGEPDACATGESCVPMGSRNDIAYCRAS